jgi:hypothetical protein
MITMPQEARTTSPLPLINQRGASLVEFAIILLVFLSMLFGVIEFGLIVYNQQVINNASREGARAGIVVRAPRKIDGVTYLRTTESEIREIVRSFASENLVTFGDDSLGDANILITKEGDKFGDVLTVEARFRYDFLVIPQLAGLVGIEIPALNLAARARMAME